MIYLKEIERKFGTIVPESVDNANNQLKNIITRKEDKFIQELKSPMTNTSSRVNLQAYILQKNS